MMWMNELWTGLLFFYFIYKHRLPLKDGQKWVNSTVYTVYVQKKEKKGKI